MPEDPRPRPTIDERLEGLARTMEILAGMQRENDRRFDQVTHKFDQVTHNFEIVLDSIKRLENIAVAHEQRLDDIEGRPQ
jgi:hypothetical protein